jgi:hypothetical protein
VEIQLYTKLAEKCVFFFGIVRNLKTGTFDNIEFLPFGRAGRCWRGHSMMKKRL